LILLVQILATGISVKSLCGKLKGKYLWRFRGEDLDAFGYEYLGTSESGIHVVHTYDQTGGSAIFHWILLLQIEEGSVLIYENESNVKTEKTPGLKLVGRLSLGDRYVGNVSMGRGVIHISKDDSHHPEHLINSSKNIVVK
jgi:hypothetical protein